MLPIPADTAINDQLRVDVTRGEPQRVARPADDGDASARISLRLSEALKADVEAAAGRDGLSVNSWLVRVATNAMAGGWPGGPGFRGWGRPGPGGRSHNSQRITGWING